MKNQNESQTSKESEVTKNENSEKEFLVIRKKRLYSFLVAAMCAVITFFNIRDYLLPLIKEQVTVDWTAIYAPVISYVFLTSLVILGVASFREIKKYSKKGLIYFLINSLWIGPLVGFFVGLIIGITNLASPSFVYIMFSCILVGLGVGFIFFLFYGFIGEFDS